MKFLCAMVAMLLLTAFAKSNNISVQKVSLADTNRVTKTVTVRFNLSWENSWRDDVNWDAAWVFVKYREKNGGWKHLKLDLAGNTIGSSAVPMKIKVPDDRQGAFVYRQANGAGKTEITGLKLLWNYGADNVADIDSVETRVFAMEMVYVPEGSFAVGDGQAENRLRSQLNEADYVVITDTMSIPLFRRMEGAMNGGAPASPAIWIDGKRGLSLDGTTISNPDFPTGYRAFYCMKYEVSQGQYADMLNTISWSTTEGGPQQIRNRPADYFPTNTGAVNRFSIALQDTVYVAAYPNRACNFLSQTGFSFADWASLRPMSEFEFEKACRGPLAPVPGEAAGGITKPFEEPSGLPVFVDENGTEVPERQDGLYKVFIMYKDNTSGPYRVGAYATAGSTRVTSGASYYGILDLNSNVHEAVILYENNSNVKGKHGDGYLSGMSASTPGSYHDIESFSWMVTHFKSNFVSGLQAYSNSAAQGFRGVRTAPSEN